MKNETNHLWTIEELVAQAALALSENYEGQGSGRTRDMPDLRTIRYYTTLGLLDRSAAMRGRTALYGRRHLLQLAAIKRLQAKGMTLAELQSQLLGLSDAELEAIAKVPAGEQSLDCKQPLPRRSANFWTEVPVPVEIEQSAPARSLDVLPLQGVQIDDKVTLLLHPARPVEADDVEAIRCAAGPLLKFLEKRRLL
jgi:DNA-binding transcriptional MerR regulator